MCRVSIQQSPQLVIHTVGFWPWINFERSKNWKVLGGFLLVFYRTFRQQWLSSIQHHRKYWGPINLCWKRVNSLDFHPHQQDTRDAQHCHQDGVREGQEASSNFQPTERLKTLPLHAHTIYHVSGKPRREPGLPPLEPAVTLLTRAVFWGPMESQGLHHHSAVKRSQSPGSVQATRGTVSRQHSPSQLGWYQWKPSRGPTFWNSNIDSMASPWADRPDDGKG